MEFDLEQFEMLAQEPKHPAMQMVRVRERKNAAKVESVLRDRCSRC